ncbi:polyprenol monophosphomannose synthase [Thermodesulfobacteriota bacterium]
MISIILPTYNEAENIGIIIQELLNLFKEKSIDCDIIVVDDNSPDGTADVAGKYSKDNPVKVFVRKSDRGLSKSVIKGFELAQGDICVVMDADLSHPVNRIPEMITPILNNECDISIGSRYIGEGGWKNLSVIRMTISKIAGFMARGVTDLSDPTSGFMAVKKSVITGLDLDPMGWKIVLETAVKAKARIIEIPIKFSDRTRGKSKLGFKAQFEYIQHLLKLYFFRYPIFHKVIKFSLLGFSGLLLICLLWLSWSKYFS